MAERERESEREGNRRANQKPDSRKPTTQQLAAEERIAHHP